MRRAVSHVRIDIAAFFRSSKQAHEYGAVVDQAMDEVRDFFSLTPEEPSSSMPRPVGLSTISATGQSPPAFPRLEYRPPSISVHRLLPESSDPSDPVIRLWDQIKPAAPSADQAEIAYLARTHLESQGVLLVVTDQLITPTKDQRYVIWDVTPSGFVLSTAPLDPKFWGEGPYDEIRRATIKRRVRSSAIAIIGTTLGLKRCSRRGCFLDRSVNSVTLLDQMFFIGPEHSESHLVGWGYPLSDLDQVPDRVEAPLRFPADAWGQP